MTVSVGTLLTGFRRLPRRPASQCEHCGAWGTHRTIYSCPLNVGDPDEGNYVLCFICILRGAREWGW